MWTTLLRLKGKLAINCRPMAVRNLAILPAYAAGQRYRATLPGNAVFVLPYNSKIYKYK
jgi:hypothetical protein